MMDFWAAVSRNPGDTSVGWFGSVLISSKSFRHPEKARAAITPVARKMCFFIALLCWGDQRLNFRLTPIVRSAGS